jgi:hypothetical protein
MLDVFFTVDVEVWCGGWDSIDEKFPSAFQRYVYGRTKEGEYGLSYKLRLLEEYGLLGVFFVEPLFATRFGLQPLQEIVGLIKQHGQEVQLHLHPEWADESIEPIIATDNKRPYLKQFSFDEQTRLIAAGMRLLEQAGGGIANAFRAGSFAFNKDTLSALATNGIAFDSSYNASTFGRDSGVMPDQILVDPAQCEGVYEYPMTVFDDGTRSLRHAQLTACSYREIEGLLWQALKVNRKAFVILSHNFELLNSAKDRPDRVVVDRFQKLCVFLDRNRDCFRVHGFKTLEPNIAADQPPPLTSPLWKTGLRVMEQIARRRYE